MWLIAAHYWIACCVTMLGFVCHHCIPVVLVLCHSMALSSYDYIAFLVMYLLPGSFLLELCHCNSNCIVKRCQDTANSGWSVNGTESSKYNKCKPNNSNLHI